MTPKLHKVLVRQRILKSTLLRLLSQQIHRTCSRSSDSACCYIRCCLCQVSALKTLKMTVTALTTCSGRATWLLKYLGK